MCTLSTKAKIIATFNLHSGKDSTPAVLQLNKGKYRVVLIIYLWLSEDE